MKPLTDELATLDDAAAISRRRFLEAAGFSFSLAAIAGCGRAPVESALPHPAQPVGVVPGRMQYFASTCAGCPSSCGLLVGTRDGRPLKMEGLPEHPLSRGGLCAVGQAQPIELYDSHRLAHPLRAGAESDWATVDREIMNTLNQVKEKKQAVRFVTPTITSPTLQAAIDAFLDRFDDGEHVVFDVVGSSAILDAHAKTHAVRALPHYRFDRADVIVSFGADFLGTWISPVEFAAAWSSRRAPTEQTPEMSYHVQFESRMSLTGTKADRRYAIHPGDRAYLVGRLAERVAANANSLSTERGHSSESDEFEDVVEDLAKRLWKARGAALVVSDSQDVGTQRLVNYINHMLGGYGATLDLARPSRQRRGDDRGVEKLIHELEADKVGALLVAHMDLVHDLPAGEGIVAAIGRVPLTVSFSHRVDDFAAIAKFVCPDHHELESWSDAEPISGLVSIAQPTLRPLRDSRAVLESLGHWSDQSITAREAIRSHWEEFVFPRRTDQARDQFQPFWDDALRNGFVEVQSEEREMLGFNDSDMKTTAKAQGTDAFSLVLYNQVSMLDARHGHNPWLQELPDPVTKVTWGNCVSVSPGDAERLELADGDIVAIAAGDDGPRLELPILVQVGQHDRVLAIALGYGVRGTDRFAKIGPQWLEARPTIPADGLVGANVAPFLEFRDGALHRTRSGVTLTKTGKRRELATTQQFNSLELPANVAPRGAERRVNVEHATLAAFAKNPHAGAVAHHHTTETQLWPEDHQKTGHAWGMVVDLNKCTGCSACVIACQSENNVPVVGYDEVRRHREMHWIRIDRYYTGDGAEMDIDHQPMMCQHCDNAPCETVCPVLATVHSSEGLNEQVYNRCVGTRYCANNCPYKVRRFNWFTYPWDDSLQNLVLNPEVTVRSRGVMEKCSMCVQRIEAGKIEASSRGRPIADGAIQTACQQSCPTSAIVFGDLNDTESTVHAAHANPRNYHVLEELNIRPSVSYLRVVKNRDTDSNEERAHG